MMNARYRMGVKVSDADPRRLALKLMRDMKRVLLELVRTWDVSVTVIEHAPGRVRLERLRRFDECPESDPEEWLALWRSAIHLRDSADRLAVFCRQEHDKIVGGRS